MATLDALQLAELRREIARDTATQDWNKTTVNAALQAIEDWFEANKVSGSTAVDTATAPYVFTGALKKKLFRFWLLEKSKREAV